MPCVALPSPISSHSRAIRRAFWRAANSRCPLCNKARATVPTITVDYKSFGVQLTFMPTVLSNGLINLRPAPSVSEIDTTNSVVISGFSIPALTTREARTTVELRDGQSFAIAGLLQSDIVENIDQLPWLGSVPVLGTRSVAPATRRAKPTSS